MRRGVGSGVSRAEGELQPMPHAAPYWHAGYVGGELLCSEGTRDVGSPSE
jgi:hypothetical protein